MLRNLMSIPAAEIPRSDKVFENFSVNIYKFTHAGNQLVLKETLKPDDDEGDQTKKQVNDEIKIMHPLDHPNLIKLQGIVEDQEIPGIIMDYMPKGTLKSYINALNEEWDDHPRFTMALGIAAGLEYLRAQRIIHRDIKSENILIDQNDIPKIIDFNCSVKLNDGDEVYSGNYGVGTFSWHAPEALKTLKDREKREYSYATDVHAFATLIWTMYSFKEPHFIKMPVSELTWQMHQFGVNLDIASGGHEDEKLITQPALKKLCLKAWSLRPDDRPAIDKFVKKLQELIEPSDDSESSDSSADSDRRYRSSYRRRK